MSKRKRLPANKPPHSRPAQASSSNAITLPQVMQRAANAYQSGDWTAAEQFCRQVLNVKADCVDALHLLGVIAAQARRTQEAAELFGRAVVANPNVASAHYNRGVMLKNLQRFDEALASYDQAISLKPDYAEAFNSRGVLLMDLKRFDEALKSHNQAIALKPNFAEAYNNRANALRELKRFDDALQSYDQAIKVKPDYAAAYVNRGNVLNYLQRFDEALKNHDQAIALRPEFAEAYNNRANALRDLKRFDEALQCLNRALQIKPDLAETYNNHGLVLHDLKQPAEAIKSYEKAISLKPNYAAAYNNLGNALHALDRPDEAIRSYEKAIALDPDYAEPYYNRSCRLAEVNLHEEALLGFGKTITLKPDHALAHMNKGMCQLTLGDFDNGWIEYEWRLQTDYLMSFVRTFTRPIWRGEKAIEGKTILLHSEQGLGDTLQFCRYAKWVAALGVRVILVVDASLLGLLNKLDGVSQLLVRGSSLPPHDYQCLLLSLPLAFKTTASSIPSATRYLESNPNKVHEWGTKLGTKTKPRAGLIWSGNSQHTNDRNRSIALTQILPLLNDKVEWVSLQKDMRDADAGLLASRPDIRHFGNELKDFADTAALVDLMDVIISVDTSTAHLAGAMGKPVWILLPFNPDWRWMLDREDSPWYPTARLFRQPAMGDWASVIDKVGKELVREIRKHSRVAQGAPECDSSSNHTDGHNNREGISEHGEQRNFETNAALTTMSKHKQAPGDKPRNPQPAQTLRSGALTLTLPQAMQQAVAAYQRRDLAEAERLCRWVLNKEPDHFDALNVLGVITAQTQRMQEAAKLLGRAVAANPDNASAHCNLGVLLKDLKRFDEALQSYDQAIRLKPDYFEAYKNRGISLMELKRFDEALQSCDRAIEIKPDYAEACNNRGVLLLELKRFDEALQSYDRAIEIKPDYAEAYVNRGNALKNLDRFDEALRSYDRALQIKPDYAEAYRNRGNALKDLKRFDEALQSYDRAIKIKPDYTEAHNNRGIALNDVKRFGEALQSYDRAIEIRPDYAEAHNNRGIALDCLKRFDEALQSYDRALQLKPQYAKSHLNRGNALRNLNRYDEALHSYDCALEIEPDFAGAHNNRGNALKDLQRFDEALKSYDLAYKIKPDYAEPRLNFAICHLLLGDFALGWNGYEWRWESEEQGKAKRNFTQPLWLGAENLEGKTILLHSEQGLGDTIQFCRYTRRVAAMGAKVVLEVQPPLLPLLAHLDGVSRVIARGSVLPAFDYHCPLLSLPLAFNTNLHSVPADIPYIGADTSRVAAWQTRLGNKTKPRVGLVWSGSVGHNNDRNRSIALAQILPLLGDAVEFISLQKEVREIDAELLSARPDIRHFGDELKDFADTAALVALMDVIISVDTSVAHLAGAMGRTVWILLPFTPDWRWMLDREDSPWYPTARLFRQPTIGDWASVIDKVGKELVGEAQKYSPVGRAIPDSDSGSNHTAGHIDLRGPGVRGARARHEFNMASAAKHQRKQTPGNTSTNHQQAQASRDGTTTMTASQAIKQAVAAYQRRDLAEAERLCRWVLNSKPDHFDALNVLGVITTQTRRTQEAAELLGRAVAANPNNASAHCNLGILLKELKRFDEALRSYDRAIGIKPDYAEAHNNRGNVLRDLKRFDEALASYGRAIESKSDYAEAYGNRGIAFKDLDRFNEALENYNHALRIKPHYAEAYGNRGIALKDLKRFEEALKSYDRAIEIRPDYAEAHNNRGNLLNDLQRFDEALKSYDRAIKIKPDYAEAYGNRGIALKDLKRFDEALQSYDRAVKIRPDYAEAHSNRGNLLNDLKRFDEALQSYDRALQIRPDYAEAYNNRGNALKDINRFDEALENYDRAFELEPDLEFLLGNRLHAKMRVCDWADFSSSISLLTQRVAWGEKASPSFPVLALTGSLPLQRKAAESWVQEKCPVSHALPKITRRARPDRIRVGYFSADYHNHATAYLMAELFEKHDRSKFELIAFSFGPDRNDDMRKRIAAAFDKFIDVRNQPDKEVALLARSLELDIAVDLKGFTQDSRPGIFALRAAPLQVNYLGYPGTMGAEYIDYLIADPTLISQAEQPHYSEKIAYLPHSYQVNDAKRLISDKVFTRASLGLPETGFVFCCFNNNFKITPGTFDGWMRILGQVKGSVLWLLEDNPTAARNLRREAVQRGVSGERLIFAKRLPLAEHLARHRAADLFIDTLPYNAHTTASDALWAGLPVLTCTGESFASRVAASLLTAIQLPELITTTQQDYESLAIELATHPDQLTQIRQKLAHNRLTTPLFDTGLFTRHIEDAYTRMVERYHADLPPDHIHVPA